MKKLIFLGLCLYVNLHAQTPTTPQMANGIELTAFDKNQAPIKVAILVEPTIEAMIKKYINQPANPENEAFLAKMALISQCIKEIKEGNFDLPIDISYLPSIVEFCEAEQNKDNKKLQECAVFARNIIASLKVLNEKFMHAMEA